MSKLVYTNVSAETQKGSQIPHFSRDCEAALYNEAKKVCQLSKVSLNNVNGVRHYFKWSKNVDMYESNCPKSKP